MTRDDAIAAIVAACPGLTKGDVKGLLNCNPDELEVLVESYQHDTALSSPDAWTTFLTILRDCEELLPLAGPIGSAVQVVFNLAHTL